MKFSSRFLESSLTQWIKCTYRKLRSNVGLLQKIYRYLLVLLHLFQQHDFPFNVYKGLVQTSAKKQALLLDQDRRGKPWINFFLDNFEDLSIKSVWYHSKWHQRSPWVIMHSHSPIKRSSWVMLCSNAPNNDSHVYLKNTVYATSYGSRLLTYCGG